ncbi:FRG domain-containing protein [Dysgonomonadaceae bacterium zrk40]|nr:FRG domain-containing protein [Dysgonomonadaceae bacterium zrk40]
MIYNELRILVDKFAVSIDSNDFDGAKTIDSVLIKYLGNDERVVPREDAPPFLQILYGYNRAMLRLNSDEIESAVLAMVDVAEIIRCYEMWDEIYYVLSMLAENKGYHDQFDHALQFACDNLMMGVVCQFKFPALSLSLLWYAEKSFVNFGRLNTVEFIKGFRQLQYRLIAFNYRNFDYYGAMLFEEKAKSVGNIKMRIPSRDEPKYYNRSTNVQEVLSDDLRKHFRESNEHIPTLEEWGLYWNNFPDYKVSESMLYHKFGHFTVKDTEELPNIFELLEVLSYDEEKYALMYDNSPIGKSIPFHEEWKELDKVTYYENELLFLPRCRVKNWYYRGQNTCYEKCQSSLHRLKCKNKIFKERLKLCEFSRIVNKHPLSELFQLGLSTQTRSGDVQHCKMHINNTALAQHYGTKTEHLDLTTDKWIATFFACTEYIKGDGVKKESYIPSEKEPQGVFYVYEDSNPFTNDWNLHPIGIQPNARPVKQSAYTINMHNDQDFNDLAFKVRFKHDSRCSSIIFKMFNKSKVLFPDEVIEKKAEIIVNSNKFSQLALNDARDRFYSHMNDSEYNELLAVSSVEIVSNPIVDYLPDEMDEAYGEIKLVRDFINLKTSNHLFGSIRI